MSGRIFRPNAHNSGAAVSQGRLEAKRQRRARLPSNFGQDEESSPPASATPSEQEVAPAESHSDDGSELTDVEEIEARLGNDITGQHEEATANSSKGNDTDEDQLDEMSDVEDVETEDGEEDPYSRGQQSDDSEAPSLHLVLDNRFFLRRILRLLSPHDVYRFRAVHPGRFTPHIDTSRSLLIKTFFLSNGQRPSVSTVALQSITFQQGAQGPSVVPGIIGNIAIFKDVGSIQLNPLLFSGRNKTLDDVSFYENEAAGCFEVRFLTRRDIESISKSDSFINRSFLSQPPTNRMTVWVRGHRYHKADDGMDTTFFAGIVLENVRGVRFGQILRETVQLVKKREKEGARMGQEIVYEVQFPKGYKVKMGKCVQMGTPLTKEELSEL